MKLTSARYKFHGGLNDFLSFQNRNKAFYHVVKGNPSIKDTLEALGAVHPEIDRIVVNNRDVDFLYIINDNDKISVYPYVKDKKFSKHLAPKNPKNPRFVLDSHLGKLTRHLRLLGFDCIYKKFFPDEEIVQISYLQKRIVLTRDIGLLKNKKVKYGYWIRNPYPDKQLTEAVKRYELKNKIKPFSLCLECNGKIKQIAKSKVTKLLPQKAAEYYDKFFICNNCKKIYWHGSHYNRLLNIVGSIRHSKN